VGARAEVGLDARGGGGEDEVDGCSSVSAPSARTASASSSPAGLVLPTLAIVGAVVALACSPLPALLMVVCCCVKQHHLRVKEQVLLLFLKQKETYRLSSWRGLHLLGW
jgi:hypothetical protein